MFSKNGEQLCSQQIRVFLQMVIILNVLTVSAVSNSIDSAKRARAHLILKLVELSYIAFILLYEPLSLH